MSLAVVTSSQLERSGVEWYGLGSALAPVPCSLLLAPCSPWQGLVIDMLLIRCDHFSCPSVRPSIFRPLCVNGVEWNGMEWALALAPVPCSLLFAPCSAPCPSILVHLFERSGVGLLEWRFGSWLLAVSRAPCSLFLGVRE